MDTAQEELQRKLYLNRGRVLLIDPPRSKVAPNKASRRISFDMLPTEVIESSVAGNTRSKNPLAAGSLPATWTIYKLSDARTAYTTRRPPFVQGKGQLNIDKARRRVALADRQGRLLENPRTAEFLAHSWDKNDFFWTLDLEGTRWIVKAYGGGPQGGVTYRKWLGVRDGFSEKPVAFSIKQLENRQEILPSPVKSSFKSFGEETETIRVMSCVDTTSEGYNDIDVDEFIDAIWSNEADRIEPAADAVSQEARSVMENIDLAQAPRSMPKTQLGFWEISGGETRFELNRSKKAKKRASDCLNEDNSMPECLSEQAAKRLCAIHRVNGNRTLQQDQEEARPTAFSSLDPSRQDLDITDTHEMVRSMQRASLDPVTSPEDTAIETHQCPIEATEAYDAQGSERTLPPATATSDWEYKQEREVSHLYSVTPPPAPFLANASAPIVPPSPRPRWLSGRPMGRCRMVAERILADRNRVVRAAGSGCRQCVDNTYECITAPGRKHCAFCTSRGSARNYFCSLATSGPQAIQPVDRAVAPAVQDDISPPTVLGDRYFGSRHFVPAKARSKNSYPIGSSIVDAAIPRPAIPQAANVAAFVEREWISIGDHAREQRAESSSRQHTELNASQPVISQQNEVPTSMPERALAAHRQANTTLQVSLGTDTSFVPIKLRSCMTISSFFDMVLAACDLEDQEHTVVGVEVQYQWIPNMRMMIKRKIPDSFAEMLEIVDEAPCWKEEGVGRCRVELRVVLR
ncbi:hypothetical protein MMC27_005115 [Xylographa pallens]|nr:hypothetical protein [Xylographa pallens]